MMIEFGHDLEAYQQARQLHLILDHYAASDHCNDDDKNLIEKLNQEIETFLTREEFKDFQTEADPEEHVMPKRNLIETLSSIWHSIMGPSRLEMKLSEQRRQLIERAERAEAMSFEALAETAEIGRERDEAVLRVKQLEGQLADPKNS